MDLNEGLGELDLRPETLRYVVCATSDLLADAAFNVEAWILDKVSRGFRATITPRLSWVMGSGSRSDCSLRIQGYRSVTLARQLHPANFRGPI
jgi:hypothetical protein